MYSSIEYLDKKYKNLLHDEHTTTRSCDKILKPNLNSEETSHFRKIPGPIFEKQLSRIKRKM